MNLPQVTHPNIDIYIYIYVHNVERYFNSKNKNQSFFLATRPYPSTKKFKNLCKAK